MNKQQLAEVKQALEALEKSLPRLAPYGEQDWLDSCKAITALQSIIAQHALDKKAENARELGLSYDDAVKGGIGIMKDGKRIDPASIYSDIVSDGGMDPRNQLDKPAPVASYCCHSCFKLDGGFMLDRMILCPECGNKRCPKASDHQLDCTGSNEPNQPGSVYTAPQPVPVQEPVAIVVAAEYEDGSTAGHRLEWRGRNEANDFPEGTEFYTAPQPVPVKTYHDGKPWPVAPMPWVGLTDEERSTIESEVLMRGENYPEVLAAIEAKLKEKNT